MTDTNIPYVTYTESTAPITSQGVGGDVIFIVGKTQHTAELTKIYEFTNPQQANADKASGGLGPDDSGNYLLKAINRIFTEARIRNASDTIGLPKIYAINVGPSPSSPTDYATAMTLSEKKTDIDIEVYMWMSSVAFANTVKTHLNTLAGKVRPRIAILTTAIDETVANIAKTTSSAEQTYIQSDRIIIKDDPTGERWMQSIFAAKVACTPPWVDPAYKEYRTDDAFDMVYDHIRSDADLSTLVNAGITPDWERIGYPEQAEPVRAVSTDFRNIDTNPAANLHQRRCVDYCMKGIAQIVMAELKNNDTETSHEFMQETAKAMLEEEKTANHIQDYELAIRPSEDDVFGVEVVGRIRPQNAQYFVDISGVIEAPI